MDNVRDEKTKSNMEINKAWTSLIFLTCKSSLSNLKSSCPVVLTTVMPHKRTNKAVQDRRLKIIFRSLFFGVNEILGHADTAMNLN